VNNQYTAAQIKELWENTDTLQNLNEFVKINFNKVFIVGRPMKLSHELYELKKTSSL
jgi:hypothetical protein